MFFKKALFVSVMIFTLTDHVYAETTFEMPEKTASSGVESKEPIIGSLEGKDANIYFYGEVSDSKVVELQHALDKINIKYPKVRAINLYLNSGGGDVDAGWTAYWAIKSSAIPVNTIGAGFVASMASIMYCAGSQRSAMQQNEFYLHAPASYGIRGGGKPDVLKRMEKRLSKVSEKMSEIYAACTSLSQQQITDITKSEFFAKSIDSNEAVKIGLSQKIAEKILPAAATIYIFDKPNSALANLI